VALLEQLSRIGETVCAANLGDMKFKKQWKRPLRILSLEWMTRLGIAYNIDVFHYPPFIYA
jgi:hypothetical protein